MGIFYDSEQRRLLAVVGAPEPGWTLVTHDLSASAHHCRRIMREWLSLAELAEVDWDVAEARRAA